LRRVRPAVPPRHAGHRPLLNYLGPALRLVCGTGAPQSLNATLQFAQKRDRLHRLVKSIHASGSLPLLEAGTRAQIAELLEKVAAAAALWQYLQAAYFGRGDVTTARTASGAARRALLDALAALASPALTTGPASTEDRIRIFLQSQVHQNATGSLRRGGRRADCGKYRLPSRCTALQTASLGSAVLEQGLQSVVAQATPAVAPVELDERIRESTACLLVRPRRTLRVAISAVLMRPYRVFALCHLGGDHGCASGPHRVRGCVWRPDHRRCPRELDWYGDARAQPRLARGRA